MSDFNSSSNRRDADLSLERESLYVTVLQLGTPYTDSMQKRRLWRKIRLQYVRHVSASAFMRAFRDSTISSSFWSKLVARAVAEGGLLGVSGLRASPIILRPEISLARSLSAVVRSPYKPSRGLFHINYRHCRLLDMLALYARLC